MTDLPNRKSPAHPAPIRQGDRPTLIQLNVCVKGRRPLLANREVHELLLEAWLEADRWRVSKYTIMPDHVHLFCYPHDYETGLKRWVYFWRNHFTRHWKTTATKPIWQKDFWDTQIRPGAHYSEKWAYVRNNPVRAGLVTNPDDWPYTGVQFPFIWI